MGEIFVITEHREGEVRDVTYEMLWKANQLCQALSHDLTAVILGGKDESFVNDIAGRADKVIVIEDDALKNFNGDMYKEIINGLLEEYRPFLTLIGHTPWGMDYAPRLSVKSGYPIATDCVDILSDDGLLKAVRQIYSGKIFSKVRFKDAEGYIATVRPSTFPPEKVEGRKGEIVKKDMVSDLPATRTQFVAFEDTGAGEVDIAQAELLVSIGRGIGEQENIEGLQELANSMGALLSCSRPIVDKNWLPKYHQVGTSGKSVRPKVYLAFGISGAFQHVAGVAGAGTIIAINKDKKAPIFRVADYGVVDDLFTVADALKSKVQG